eukprot:328108_1
MLFNSKRVMSIVDDESDDSDEDSTDEESEEESDEQETKSTYLQTRSNNKKYNKKRIQINKIPTIHETKQYEDEIKTDNNIKKTPNISIPSEMDQNEKHIIKCDNNTDNVNVKMNEIQSVAVDTSKSESNIENTNVNEQPPTSTIQLQNTTLTHVEYIEKNQKQHLNLVETVNSNIEDTKENTQDINEITIDNTMSNDTNEIIHTENMKIDLEHTETVYDNNQKQKQKQKNNANEFDEKQIELIPTESV